MPGKSRVGGQRRFLHLIEQTVGAISTEVIVGRESKRSVHTPCR